MMSTFTQGRSTRLKPIVLLVDDDPADQELARRIMATSSHRTELHAVDDGDDALSFLRRQGRFANAPRPDLLLLDLNMPRRTGHEVLRDIRCDPSLARLVVVVLSTSDQEQDVDTSYAMGANAFIVKPSGAGAMARVLRQVEDFWFGVVTLPSGER